MSAALRANILPTVEATLQHAVYPGQQLAWHKLVCSWLSMCMALYLHSPDADLFFTLCALGRHLTCPTLVSGLTCVNFQFMLSLLSSSGAASQHHPIVYSSDSPSVFPDQQSQHHLGSFWKFNISRLSSDLLENLAVETSHLCSPLGDSDAGLFEKGRGWC